MLHYVIICYVVLWYVYYYIRSCTTRLVLSFCIYFMLFLSRVLQCCLFLLGFFLCFARSFLLFLIENLGSFFIHFLLPSLLSLFRSCVLCFSRSTFLSFCRSFFLAFFLSLALSAGRRGGSAPPGSLSLSRSLSLSLCCLKQVNVVRCLSNFVYVCLIFWMPI